MITFQCEILFFSKLSLTKRQNNAFKSDKSMHFNCKPYQIMCNIFFPFKTYCKVIIVTPPNSKLDVCFVVISIVYKVYKISWKTETQLGTYTTDRTVVQG